jgi:hypothetical protein
MAWRNDTAPLCLYKVFLCHFTFHCIDPERLRELRYVSHMFVLLVMCKVGFSFGLGLQMLYFPFRLTKTGTASQLQSGVWWFYKMFVWRFVLAFFCCVPGLVWIPLSSLHILTAFSLSLDIIIFCLSVTWLEQLWLVGIGVLDSSGYIWLGGQRICLCRVVRHWRYLFSSSWRHKGGESSSNIHTTYLTKYLSILISLLLLFLVSFFLLFGTKYLL